MTMVMMVIMATTIMAIVDADAGATVIHHITDTLIYIMVVDLTMAGGNT